MSKKKKKQQQQQPAKSGEARHSSEGVASAGSSAAAVAPRAFASLAKEGVEPGFGEAGLPLLLVVLLGALVYWADLSFLENAGEFNPKVYPPFVSYRNVEDYNPSDPVEMKRRQGERVYKTACVACHQDSGAGVAGQFPPLAGSDWVLATKPDRIIRIVLNGFSGPATVKGAAYNNAMPPWKGSYNDDDIAAVITYIRSSWGNKASEVKAAEVKAIRDLLKDNDSPMSEPELLKVPVQ